MFELKLVLGLEVLILPPILIVSGFIWFFGMGLSFLTTIINLAYLMLSYPLDLKVWYFVREAEYSPQSIVQMTLIVFLQRLLEGVNLL